MKFSLTLIILVSLISCSNQSPKMVWSELQSSNYKLDSVYFEKMYGIDSINKIKGYQNDLAHGYELDFYFDESIKRIVFWRKGVKTAEVRSYYPNGTLHEYKFYDSYGNLMYISRFNENDEQQIERGELCPYVVLETNSKNNYILNDTLVYEIFIPTIDKYKNAILNTWVLTENNDTTNYVSEKISVFINFRKIILETSGLNYWKYQIVTSKNHSTILDSMALLVE